jgi:hypothetical protein
VIQEVLHRALERVFDALEVPQVENFWSGSARVASSPKFKSASPKDRAASTE